MSRILAIAAAAALLSAQAATAVGTIGTLTFSGHVLTHNGVPVPPEVDDRVLGSITLSDGSDPDGPAATPADFTGTVTFSDFFDDPGNATFDYKIDNAFSGSFADVNPYHFASVTLVNGRLVGLDLFTDGYGDTFELATTSFDHTRFDGSHDSGTWRLDLPSDTPEPASWTLMLAGFTAVGCTLRKRVAVA